MSTIIKKTISDQIYETLKKDIITHKIPSGAKVVNRDLQNVFGVSSTPIRDSLNRLYQDGLLEQITNAGAKVKIITLKDALEINQICCMLDTSAVFLMMKKEIRPEAISNISNYIENQINALNNNEPDAYIHFDDLFHRTLFIECGNSRMLEMYDKNRALYDMLVTTYHNQGIKRRAFEEHIQVLEAIKKSDAEKAIQHLKIHYAHAEDSFNEIF